MTTRSYGQFCATANALEVIGDRCTLLIVRGLLLGPTLLPWMSLPSSSENAGRYLGNSQYCVYNGPKFAQARKSAASRSRAPNAVQALGR